ncbi:MAG TPA: hypothetical protein VD886_13640 [Herpetosiphonaceae bacterium]|nr:hypothetical protein [Herpetosiphonaceae bacterium]
MIEGLIVHERTVLGALDSFSGTLVRSRPYLAAAYGAILEEFAARWLDSGYPNEIDAVSDNWVRAFIASSEDRQLAREALRAFFVWAFEQKLVATHALTNVLD